MSIDWNVLITSGIGLVGVVIGVIGSSFGQHILANKQHKIQIQKDKESKNLERLSVYSEILKLDGENQMQGYMGGGRAELNLSAYRNIIRPIFYSKFHLLDKDIAKKVRDVDSILLDTDFFEEINDEQTFRLLTLYYEIIVAIENHLEKYRNTI